jgi:arabinofuranosyltransferase
MAAQQDGVDATWAFGEDMTSPSAKGPSLIQPESPPTDAPAKRIDRILQVFAGPARSSRFLLGLRLVCMAILGFVLVRTAWMGDDAFITLRTVDNFVNGHGLRWNIAERVQTFTHPLWLFVLTVPYLITREAFYTVMVVSIVISLLTVAILLFRSRAEPGPLAMGFVILLSSRAFIDYSTSGLENPVTHLLLLLFLLRLPDEAPGARRATELALLAGLAALNRMDSLILFAPGLAYAMRRARAPRDFVPLVAGFAPFLVWEVFSTVYYGFPYPNTAAAKLRAGIAAAPLMRQGLHYFPDSLRRDPATLTTIAVALAWTAYRRRPRELAIGGGVLLYMLYTIRIGGDFMSGRFFSAPLLAAVVLLVRAGPFRFAFLRPAFAAIVLCLGLLAPYPPYLTGRDFGTVKEDLIDRHGICDERRFYFGMSGMLNQHPANLKPTGEATQMGQQLKRGRVPLAVEGAVGATGYFAGPSVHLVDYHALGDPLLARMPMVAHDRRYDRALLALGGFTDLQGWRIGHFLRNIPKGYITTLLTGKNSLADANLARFYDHLHVITRGPLWSGRRFAEILQMNAGRYDSLVDRTRPPLDSGIGWDEYIAIRPDVAEPYYRRAREEIDNRAPDRAIADLREALRRDPEHIDALILLGKLLSENNQTEEAVSIWNRIRSLDPRNTSPYVYLADIVLHEGAYERAIDLLMEAYRLDPCLVIACNNLGIAYYLLGDYPQALAWLSRTLKFQPRSANTHEDIGRVYLEMGNYKKAVTMLERAIELDPKRTSAMIGNASAHNSLGDAPKAIAQLRQAAALSPQDPEVLFELGQLLESSGRAGEGLEQIRQAARLGYGAAQQELTSRGLGW